MAYYGSIEQDEREDINMWRTIAEELFKLLDNIDGACGKNSTAVQISKKRFDYLETDGHDLFLPGRKLEEKKREKRFKLKEEF